jgi:uncharacterized protein involved in type VI secretion and phage assembly
MSDNGILIGVVTDLEDPEGLGRVRVSYPTLDNQRSDWARLATFMAGNGRGGFFRPEPQDEVLVAFENGDPRRPYVIGAMWSKADQPPADDGNPAENNWRMIVSRSGAVLRFDDTAGSEKIEVIDKDGKRRVVLDSARARVEVAADAGDVEISAASSVTIDAGQNIALTANGNISIKATGRVTVEGVTIELN